MSLNASTPAGEFKAGIRDTLPLVVSAIPFGIIFGALAVARGISPAGTLGLSLFVFAGASQFIAVGLVAQGTGIGLIVLTTFIVNLRHALYSTTLAPHMSHLSQKWLLPLAFWLTDESFVVAAARYQRADASPFKHWYFLGSAVLMYTDWQLSTLVGVIAGQSIPDPLSWGLDFAMSVTFIGLVVPMVKNRPMLVTVLVASVTAVLAHGLPNQLGLMLAAVVGIAAGLITEQTSEVSKTSEVSQADQ